MAPSAIRTAVVDVPGTRWAQGVRVHDLRHTYASFGAASGLGLPVIGRLLGHREAATTQRYAHLDNDPIRRASGAIGTTIPAGMWRAWDHQLFVA